MNEFDGIPYDGTDKALMSGFVRSMRDTHRGSCDDCAASRPCPMFEAYTRVLVRVQATDGSV